MQISLDVVTDGSEKTTSTVFLTVTRTSTTESPAIHAGSTSASTPTPASAPVEPTNHEAEDTGTILARYALSGISTLTSRLAADQRFKLSPVRAVFCPAAFGDSRSELVEKNENENANANAKERTMSLSSNIPYITGIPSLLLSLSNYSLTGKLHIVGGQNMDVYANHVAEIILNRRKYPEVVTCVVPPIRKESVSTWWKVYTDEYIIVHARFHSRGEEDMEDGDSGDSSSDSDDSSSDDDSSDDDSESSDEILKRSKPDECNSQDNGRSKDSSETNGNHHDDYHTSLNTQNQNQQSDIIYIMTLRQQRYSFAVFPPNMPIDTAGNGSIFQHLPAEVTEHAQDGLEPLEFILHVNPCLHHHHPSYNIVESNKSKSVHDLKAWVHPQIRRLARRHFATVPTEHIRPADALDDGLLTRSLKQTRLLNFHFPYAYPLNSSWNESNEPEGDDCRSDVEVDDVDVDTKGLVSFHRIRSFTSTILHKSTIHGGDPSKEITTINRNLQMGRSHSDTNRPAEELENTAFSQKIHALKRFYGEQSSKISITTKSDHIPPTDNNEIDLSSDEEDLDGPPSCTGDDNIVPTALDADGDNSYYHQNSAYDATTDTTSKRQKLYHPVKKSSIEMEEFNDVDTSVPHLLVLGTGCASPAPLRGSSGYGIFMPTVVDGTPSLALTIVLECGEGCLTMLGRYGFNHIKNDRSHQSLLERNLSTIRVIWISHAHLDHYGDLPNLIHEINRINGGGRNMCICYLRQRRAGNKMDDPFFHTKAKANGIWRLCKRCGRVSVPIVIAPPKVLYYLDNSLQCKNGKLGGKQLYLGISQRDFEFSPFCQQIRDDVFGIEVPIQDFGDQSSYTVYRPIAFLNNISVEHCPNAYACFLGLHIPSIERKGGSLFILAYSGDTRPSSNFVRVCNDLSNAHHMNTSLLLHEATFDDDSKGKQEAMKKKHSTVNEAMAISRKINADAVLLTHFSQRYPKIPPGFKHNSCVPREENQISSAYDGMRIPLKDGMNEMLPALLGSLTLTVLSSPNSDDNDHQQSSSG